MAAPSGFLALPAEIRNRIYEYVLLQHHVSMAPFAINPHTPGLLRVNKQARAEAIGIYYLRNNFKIWLLREQVGRLNHRLPKVVRRVMYQSRWELVVVEV
ncbi:hypothetical protein LTR62_007319 [Meristemomyces frigidus]|uniref:2EXR domain-containing protein n=1 Tax=Meristemomyces frigidus TaxID=1508187 RepID=A0AAN7YME7_9PEZI|nr:hypothetical protein LTR62_007319 [Meristemomyces frigidus]